MDNLIRDLRYTFRSLRRRPGFAVVTILTLALGIGASTAIFSVAADVSLRALPYPEGERLARIWEQKADDENRRWNTSYLGYRDWAKELESLEDVGAAALFNPLVLAGEGEPARIWSTFASPSYLRLLGAAPIHGRLIGPEDDQAPGAHPVAVISEALWQRRFGGDDDVLGQTLTLAERDYEVIGVMSGEFADLSAPAVDVDVWLPIMMLQHVYPPDCFESRFRRGLTVIGRLRPGHDLAHLESEVQGVAGRHAEAYPDSHGNVTATAQDLRTVILGNLEGPVLALMGGAVFLLMVAGINVTSLMLVRGAGRRRELAVRSALGASRRELTRQLLMESVVLAAASAVQGLGLAAAVLRSMPGISAIQLPAFVDLRLDAGAVAFAMTVALAGALATAWLPILRARRADLRADLGQRGGGDRRGQTTTHALVIVEVATAVVLVVGSGLLIRSLQTLRGTDVGFATQERLGMRISLPQARYPEPGDAHEAVGELRRRLGALTGVDSVGVWSPNLPGQPSTLTTFVPEGTVVASQLEAELGRFHQVSAGAIEQLDIPLLQGRTIGEQDHAGALPVVVVCESLAEVLWPGQNPLGQRLTNWIPPEADPADFPIYTVVGVVADARLGGRTNLAIPTPNDAYFSHAQRTHASVNQLVTILEARGDLDTVAAGLTVFDPATRLVERVVSLPGLTYAVAVTAAGDEVHVATEPNLVSCGTNCETPGPFHLTVLDGSSLLPLRSMELGAGGSLALGSFLTEGVVTGGAPLPPAVDVPTLSPGGLALLIVLVVFLGWRHLGRRRPGVAVPPSRPV